MPRRPLLALGLLLAVIPMAGCGSEDPKLIPQTRASALTSTIDEIRPGELWITHGREEALARWAELHGVPARALALVGYEEEAED